MATLWLVVSLALVLAGSQCGAGAGSDAEDWPGSQYVAEVGAGSVAGKQSFDLA